MRKIIREKACFSGGQMKKNQRSRADQLKNLRFWEKNNFSLLLFSLQIRTRVRLPSSSVEHKIREKYLFPSVEDWTVTVWSCLTPPRGFYAVNSFLAKRRMTWVWELALFLLHLRSESCAGAWGQKEFRVKIMGRIRQSWVESGLWENIWCIYVYLQIGTVFHSLCFGILRKSRRNLNKVEIVNPGLLGNMWFMFSSNLNFLPLLFSLGKVLSDIREVRIIREGR